MLATLLHMPRWLVAVVALCVLGGYLQQAECKLFGCQHSHTAEAQTAEHGTGSASHSEDGQCQCQCHFVTLAPGETSASYCPLVRVAVLYPSKWIEHTSEAPCADIEHPPQLA